MEFTLFDWGAILVIGVVFTLAIDFVGGIFSNVYI